MSEINWKTKEKSELVNAILSLKNKDETERFLRDLLTEGEIEEFARRFRAAELLAENVPYSRIEAETGLSSTTVARVSKWLSGDLGGYRTVIARLHHHSTSLARGS